MSSVAPEFSRKVDLRGIEEAPLHLNASAVERANLSRRFDLVAIDRLEAWVELAQEGKRIIATGRLSAEIVQSCAVSAEDLAVSIDEPLALRFVREPALRPPDSEIELSAEELDEIPFAGTVFDLGEAVAQSLDLAIDRFAVGPAAEAARRRAGILDPEASGPFAALAGLRKRD